MTGESKKGEYVPRCRICHRQIEKFHIFDSVEIICEECFRRFPEKELFIMIELFNEYGGWFNKIDDHAEREKPLTQKIEEQLDNFDEDNLSFFELNSRMIHQGLLHGIPYPEYEESLKNFLSEEEEE